MSTFRNLKTGVVVSVADEKDGRFASGWEPAPAEKPAPKKSTAKSEK